MAAYLDSSSEEHIKFTEITEENRKIIPTEYRKVAGKVGYKRIE